MKNFVAALALLTAVVALTPGCYTTMDDRSKVGAPFKKDKISGTYERNVDEVQAAARKVLQFNGTILSDDVVNRLLSAKIDTRNVYVKLVELEPTVTQVTVQARTKGGGADVDLAAEIEKQIALNLK